ncbi:MAG: hypothetical protein ACRC6M_16905 [Microcystaceae cyanobacterium]
MTVTNQLEIALQEIVTMVEAVSQSCGDDCDRLLALLRTLEGLHRQIRTEKFEPSLPNTRKELYYFLRDVEESGGWPYIERGKLQHFVQYLVQAEAEAVLESTEVDI